MAKAHNLGFPRIGANRELKKAQEAYWKGRISKEELIETGVMLRKNNWTIQSGLDWVPVGDFSFYDHVLDMSFTLGNIPSRAQKAGGDLFDQFFRVARGRSPVDGTSEGVAAGEMTKWFDTNYHYIVPEFSEETHFSPDVTRLIEQIDEARAAGVSAKPVLLGPVSYLRLGKEKGNIDKLALLDSLLKAYEVILGALEEKNVEWVQIDEPVLVMDLEEEWKEAFRKAYAALSGLKIKKMAACYFGTLGDNLDLALSLPIDAIHVDAVRGRSEVQKVIEKLPAGMELSLGVIDGRNIWKTDLTALLEWLEPIADKLGDRLWLAPSCSLLHVPVDLSLEKSMDSEILSWLAFAVQKLDELVVLAGAVNKGREAAEAKLEANRLALESRRTSSRVNIPEVKARAAAATPDMGRRKSPYAERAALQENILGLPLFPTTTIGSYPQTAEIRSVRRKFKKGEIDEKTYTERIRAEVRNVVAVQEELGLDVLVHGEPERNDMVEYFGEQLEGYVFSGNGWVQSYGSRCVKPPILFGDIRRPKPMTIDWITYAQSLTDKPMKGMLTGPVTILNWSFVRDDQPRSETCLQLALAVRDEVLDLEKAGIKVIQIDEAALREGLPLRKADWKEYLDWAVGSFRITANGVEDKTQIHTHMCYSEFNDIIESIAEMDTDVITIETSRSDMELLDVFDKFAYPNEIGPGVYDIHSPNVPKTEYMIDLMQKAAKRIPKRRLWVNPDCGLKTRDWPETKASLKNMVEAAHRLRETA